MFYFEVSDNFENQQTRYNNNGNHTNGAWHQTQHCQDIKKEVLLNAFRQQYNFSRWLVNSYWNSDNMSNCHRILRQH